MYHENRNAVDDWGTTFFPLPALRTRQNEIVREVLLREDGTQSIYPKASGSREVVGRHSGLRGIFGSNYYLARAWFSFLPPQLDTYDTFEGLPEWAKITLNEHASVQT